MYFPKSYKEKIYTNDSIIFTSRNYKTKYISLIAKATIDLATSLKNDDNTVTVSGIVPSLDDLNNKANEVNRRLVLMCKERNISYRSHDESIDPENFLDFW